MDIKNNTTELQEILNAVNALSESVISLPTLTNAGKASDLLEGKQLIDENGNIITGTIQIVPGKDIIPTTIDQIVVTSGKYVDEDIMVSGDSNLVAENIKKGVSIFGVNGTLSGGSSNIETEFENWTLTYKDGTTKEENMEEIKYYPVYYIFEGSITSSNTATKIRSGEDYVTILSSEYKTESGGTGYGTFGEIYVSIVYSDGVESLYDFEPDKKETHLAYITIPAAIISDNKYIEIFANLVPGNVEDDW
jgi:hypothetical protein